MVSTMFHESEIGVTVFRQIDCDNLWRRFPVSGSSQSSPAGVVLVGRQRAGEHQFPLARL